MGVPESHLGKTSQVFSTETQNNVIRRSRDRETYRTPYPGQEVHSDPNT